MALGTKNDLIKAANGIFRPRQTPPVEPPAPESSPYLEAMRRKADYSTTPTERMYGGATPSSTAMSPTQTYGRLMTGLTRPAGGLSSEGKYGGFYSAGDLETAISGSAMRFATEAPSALRSGARQRYAQLDPMYNIAQRQYLMPGAYDQGLQKKYVRQLGEWYAQNAAPAEEYLATAQQIESTPVSNLATAIASQTYGMNPDLARGKFAGLDKRMFEEQRDIQFRQRFGVPYEQYKFEQDQAMGTAREAAKSQIAQIESATGNTISQIRSYSRLNDQSLYQAVNMPDVQFQDENGETVSTSATQAIETALSYYDAGDEDSIVKFIGDIKQRQGQEDVARLIEAIIGLRSRAATTNRGYFADYLLTDPYGE
jgi:hypothetical protein